MAIPNPKTFRLLFVGTLLTLVVGVVGTVGFLFLLPWYSE
jgi:hypothetical protein